MQGFGAFGGSAPTALTLAANGDVLSANTSAGIFRVDPATGASTMWLHEKLLAGIVWDDADLLWKSVADLTQGYAYYGHLEGGSTYAPVGRFGTMTAAPTSVTATRRSSWGAIKRSYR